MIALCKQYVQSLQQQCKFEPLKFALALQRLHLRILFTYSRSLLRSVPLTRPLAGFEPPKNGGIGEGGSVEGLCMCVLGELDMGRVHPWVGLGHKILRLGWVGFRRVQCQKCLINIQCTRKKPIIRHDDKKF